MNHQSQETIDDLIRELERTRSELDRARLRIAHMEASKFWKARNLWWAFKERLLDPRLLFAQKPATEPSPIVLDLTGLPGSEPVVPPLPTRKTDIIICIHNALDDVRRCLESVVAHTRPPFRLILVDDGSGPETRDFVLSASERLNAFLLRNETAQGYTLAANQGLRASDAAYAVLLNSDTVVTDGWLERLVAAVESDACAGIAGPMSNCASWQSIPEIVSLQSDWSENPLPEGIDANAMARMLATDVAPIRPELPFLNGFCLLIRRELINAIGIFDEETFRRGYGEENDYSLRTRKAGWKLILADDAYVFHAQSRSYSSEKRQELSRLAHEALLKKHGSTDVERGVASLHHGRVLEGLRARARERFHRFRLVEKGRERFAGKRVLFVLPVRERGGGANVVLSEAKAMRRMGVDVQILNLPEAAASFKSAYPESDIPLLTASPKDLTSAARGFDAVIATANTSVAWLESLPGTGTVLGYYIQDYEPHFYEEGTPGHAEAKASYNRIPGLVSFTKTDWNRIEVEKHTGVAPSVVGPSFEIDRFRPFRETPAPSPVRIAAMIRPSSPRRGPDITMEAFQEVSRRYGAAVQFFIYGVDPSDPAFQRLARDFPFSHLGFADGPVLAALFNQIHVFADFSTYQAMGLSALEAMGCGATAILPSRGGVRSFAIPEENAVLTDTLTLSACVAALSGLIEDGERRSRLMERAFRDVQRFFPEGPAFKILSLLFS
jgi:GT2 family glycosyltransferase